MQGDAGGDVEDGEGACAGDEAANVPVWGCSVCWSRPAGEHGGIADGGGDGSGPGEVEMKILMRIGVDVRPNDPNDLRHATAAELGRSTRLGCHQLACHPAITSGGDERRGFQRSDGHGPLVLPSAQLGHGRNESPRAAQRYRERRWDLGNMFST